MFQSLNIPILPRQGDMTNHVYILTFVVAGRPASRPGYEADQSPLSNPKVKNAWRYSSTSLSVFKTPRFIKHEDNFTISE